MLLPQDKHVIAISLNIIILDPSTTFEIYNVILCDYSHMTLFFFMLAIYYTECKGRPW